MRRWERVRKSFIFDWLCKDTAESFSPFADEPYALFFDSSRPSHPLSRYSYLCVRPFETIEARGGKVSVTNEENSFVYSADPFQVVRERIALWGAGVKPRAGLPPFHGGAAGFFGYDLARGIEKLPSRAKDSGQPDLCIGLYDCVIAFDHAKDAACLIVQAEDEAQAIAKKNSLEAVAARQRMVSPCQPEWRTVRDDEAFSKDIARVIEYIHAGDIFQANLSRRFTAEIPQDFDAYAHYIRLRRINPAPYGAFMNFGGMTLASSSPERFLETSGRRIETRPIKGTMPSSLPASTLENSEKDRAENVMIVDLLRNDLSKVCEDHSISVDRLCGIETFEGLHHMVSVVSGRLRGDQGPLEALRACFPGGSITGAPKIRAMEIIEELEPDRRGAYCGALGWIGFDGAMDTAITIRTLVYKDGEVQLQTGGGITAESDPEKELQETLTKAAKMFESFSASDAEGTA